MPVLQAYSGPRKGVYVVPARRLDKIAQEVLRIAGDLPDRPMIVTPTRAGPAGMGELNVRFHELAAVTEQVRGQAGQAIGLGEPVIHLRNDYKRNLYNGSTGLVTVVSPEAEGASDHAPT